MSTKFNPLGYPGCNPKVPLHVVDAAYARRSAINDLNAAKDRQAAPPGPRNGGRGARRIQRANLKSKGLL